MYFSKVFRSSFPDTLCQPPDGSPREEVPRHRVANARETESTCHPSHPRHNRYIGYDWSEPRTHYSGFHLIRITQIEIVGPMGKTECPFQGNGCCKTATCRRCAYSPHSKGHRRGQSPQTPPVSLAARIRAGSRRQPLIQLLPIQRADLTGPLGRTGTPHRRREFCYRPYRRIHRNHRRGSGFRRCLRAG